MLLINDLPRDSFFYSTKKFSLEFKDGSYKYGGVIRFGHSIVKKWKVLGGKKFKSVSTLPYSHHDEEEQIVSSSYFDNSMMIMETESDLLRAWYINASETIESFKTYHDKGRDLTEWILESNKIKEAMEKNPEKWL